MDFYQKQLLIQLDFLKRSCERFDQGYQHESISMTGVLRILFRSTKKMTSLFEHLKKENINLLSTCTGIPIGFPGSSGYFGLVQFSSEGPRAKLNFAPRPIDVPFVDWWNQIVFMPTKGYEYSRQDLVVSIADQGGGSHVDAEEKLREKYKKLVESDWSFIAIDNNGISRSCKVNSFHLVSVRQIAFEVLNSYEIKKLM